MAKVYGITGKANGKFGNAVFRIRYGQQIMAQYNPVVANPRTAAQVEARAKLKLLSQLSASMAPAIAIPREGPISPRNFFTRYNYDFVSYAPGSDNSTQASVQLSQLQITHSTLTLPEVSFTHEGNNFTVQLAGSASQLSSVVYAIFSVQTDGTLRFLGSEISSTGPRFDATFTASGSKIVVYAYGVQPLSEMARVKYEQMNVSSATLLASLVANRTLTVNDVAVTETKYADLTA